MNGPIWVINVSVVTLLVLTIVFDMVKKQTNDAGECDQQCKWNRLQFVFILILLFAMATDMSPLLTESVSKKQVSRHSFPILSTMLLFVIIGLSSANAQKHDNDVGAILIALFAGMTLVSMCLANKKWNKKNSPLHLIFKGLNWFEKLNGIPAVTYGMLIVWNILQLANIQLCHADASETQCKPWTTIDGVKDSSSQSMGMRGGMLTILIIMFVFTASNSEDKAHKRRPVYLLGIVALLSIIGYMLVDQGYQQYSIDLVLVLFLAASHSSFRVNKHGKRMIDKLKEHVASETSGSASETGTSNAVTSSEGNSAPLED